MMGIPERSELNPAFTWALEDLYPGDQAWQEAFEENKNTLRRSRAMRADWAQVQRSCWSTCG